MVAALYYYLYRDAFTRGAILINVTQRRTVSRIRPEAARARASAESQMMVFGLGQDYHLTDIQVVNLAKSPGDQAPKLAWHMISDSTSPPLQSFVYGEGIPGMHPPVLGTPAEPLSPGTQYRVIVRARSLKGQHDFQIPREEAAAHP